MKKLLILSLLLVCAFCAHSQSLIKLIEITYLEGSQEELLEKTYPIKICSLMVEKTTNTYKCPVLYYFYENRYKYIGGTIKNYKTGETTKITNMQIKNMDDGNTELVIIGEKHQVIFKADNSELLRIEQNKILFYIKGQNIWEIYKQS